MRIIIQACAYIIQTQKYKISIHEKKIVYTYKFVHTYEMSHKRIQKIYTHKIKHVPTHRAIFN